MSKDVKEKPKKKSSKLKNLEGMPLINYNAAVIDTGDTLHVVAVPEGRDVKNVKSFGAFTCDLRECLSPLPLASPISFFQIQKGEGKTSSPGFYVWIVLLKMQIEYFLLKVRPPLLFLL